MLEELVKPTETKGSHELVWIIIYAYMVANSNTDSLNMTITCWYNGPQSLYHLSTRFFFKCNWLQRSSLRSPTASSPTWSSWGTTWSSHRPLISTAQRSPVYWNLHKRCLKVFSASRWCPWPSGSSYRPKVAWPLCCIFYCQVAATPPGLFLLLFFAIIFWIVANFLPKVTPRD